MSRDGQEPLEGAEGGNGWQSQCFTELTDTADAGTGVYNPKPPGDESDGCATEFTRLSNCCVAKGITASQEDKKAAIEGCA
tara:strand:+ start:1033 stop:1275 length:243 start_codon:yes stop_codon:yes gene_type:complete